MSNPLPGDPETPRVGDVGEHDALGSSTSGNAPLWEEPATAAPTGEQRLDAAELPTAEEANPAGRGAMVSTAGRIGTAVGNVQRRTLELVRRPARTLEFPSTTHDAVQSAADMMREIEEQAATVRKQAARKLEGLSTQAEERYREFTTVVRTRLSRSFSRTLQLADSHPLQTIAAFAAAGFAFGVALRFRRPRRG
jgi:ElaB/YqjD/DUF883 family membrane-anchored ribosome-binding protein